MNIARPHALTLAAALLGGCAHAGAMLPPTLGADAGSNDRTALAPFAQGVPAHSLGPVRFAVALPLRNQAALHRFLAEVSDPRSPQYAHFLTHEQFLERYAPAARDLAVVARSLRNAGFNVSVSDQAVHAGGSHALAERYFATRLNADAAGGFVRARELALPAALAARGAMVVGFEPMHFHVDSRVFAAAGDAAIHPRNATSAVGPYYTSDLKQAYQFPSFQQVSGRNVTIGIVMASPVMSSDIQVYFNVQRIPLTVRVENSSVAGGGTYDPSSGNTKEATLDVEQALGMAPRAKAIVFNPPSLSSGDVYDAYGAVIADPRVKIVNSSFSHCESEDPFRDYQPFEQDFQEGIAEGQTFVASSGDNADSACGSNAQGNSNVRGVAWPASSIQVLAVGGTNLTTQFVRGTKASGYVSEQAYEDNTGSGSAWGSGGGYSTPGYFARQSWQEGFDPRPQRGVPDVSLHMGGCPNDVVGPCRASDSSDVLVLAGRSLSAIGTSASSPDMCGLIALAIEGEHQPSGFGDIHDLLYVNASEGNWRRGIHGFNGYTTNGSAWDPVVGLGTPIAAYKIAGATAAAGVPGTPSNP